MPAGPVSAGPMAPRLCCWPGGEEKSNQTEQLKKVLGRELELEKGQRDKEREKSKRGNSGKEMQEGD